MSSTKPYWVRWYDRNPTAFEYEGPWWKSGVSDDAVVLVAAVMARDEEHARQIIRSAHDDGADQEWSFVEPRADDWAPFSDRFKGSPWMKWPWPVAP
jgi:hypothetical protein